MYPPRRDWRDMDERRADIAISKQRCAAVPDPDACAKQAREQLLDEQWADARRYLPRCASMTGGSNTACERRAEQSMQTARLVRRCQIAPTLAQCATRKSSQDTPKTENEGAPDQ